MEEAIAGATKVLPHTPTVRGKAPAPVTTAHVWLICRRLLVLAAAVLYVHTLVEGGMKAIETLFGVVDDSIQFETMRCPLIGAYAGASTISSSKLVTAALDGSTEPSDATIYLLSTDLVSFDGCAPETIYNTDIYNNSFLRTQYADLVRDTSYNISLFKTTELIAPIVDCSSTILLSDLVTYMRVFYLVRSKTDHDVVSLLTYSFSMQDYRFPDQYQTGVTGVLTLAVVSDMRFQQVEALHHVVALAYPFRKGSYSVYEYRDDTADGYRVFESIPINANDVTRVIYTARRTGVFTSESESEQGNLKHANTMYSLNPLESMSEWQWHGLSLLHNAWTWVHAIHFVYALDMVFTLLVVLLVVYRNFQKGKLWIGDAFISVSRSVVLRGCVVLVAWYLDGFWTLMEFCLQEGKILSNSQHMFIYEQIIHADLLVLYLSLAGALGFVLRERIDPALAVFLFEIGFANRLAFNQWLPAALEEVTQFFLDDLAAGIKAVNPKLAGISPLRFRTTHQLHAKSVSAAFATCAPLLLTFAVLVAYVPIRKVYRRVYPDRMVQLSRGTNLSTESDAILAWKHSLTMFEVATGAALQNRVGLVSDYDNCVYIKGMKFASADGVFCNGFVVANHKWLVRIVDLPLLLTMVVLRVRIADVYVYEVNAFTVQKNARLFYPEMLAFVELFQLNTMILA